MTTIDPGAHRRRYLTRSAVDFGPCTYDEGACPHPGVLVLQRRLGGADLLGEVRFAGGSAGARYQQVSSAVEHLPDVACEHHAHDVLDQLIRDAAAVRQRAEHHLETNA